MNEFAERVMVRNIQQLLSERGIERTPSQVRVYARQRARGSKLPIASVYDQLEDQLLSQNPNAGEWGEI